MEGDFTAGYDEELAGEIEAHGRLRWFDLEAETARPFDGIGSTGSGFSMGKLDGRTFVFVPNTDWTVTTIYELDQDGEASARFDVKGIFHNWLRPR